LYLFVIPGKTVIAGIESVSIQKSFDDYLINLSIGQVHVKQARTKRRKECPNQENIYQADRNTEKEFFDIFAQRAQS